MAEQRRSQQGQVNNEEMLNCQAESADPQYKNYEDETFLICNKASSTPFSMSEQADLLRISSESGAMKEKVAIKARLRQTHMLEMTKIKYQRMIELQHQNFIERNQLEKERQQFLKEEKTKIRIKIQKQRKQQDHSGLSAKNWRRHNMQEGAFERKLKLKNQFVMIERENMQLSQKKQTVGNRHKSMYLRREKLLEFKGEGFSKKNQLQIHQEYRCGFIHKMTQGKNPLVAENVKWESDAPVRILGIGSGIFGARKLQYK